MTDFLYRLVDRSYGVPTVAAPMIGALFGRGPDVPPTVDNFVDHGGSERTTNGVGDSSGARSGNAALDSPLVAGGGASFQVADQTTATRMTDRTTLADQHPNYFERPFLKRTNLFSPMGSTAQLDPGPDRGDDIRIDEKRSTDGHEISRALTAETRERPVDVDPTSAVPTLISTRDLRRQRQAVDSEHPSTEVVDSTGDFEKPRQEALPLARARGATAQLDERDQGRVTLQRAAEINSPATLTVKAQRGSVESLDSDGLTQRPQESTQSPTGSVLSKDGSRTAPAENVGAGEAPRPIVVSPRIVTDRPSERYAIDQPSVRPAADPIASRREDVDSTTPTIRVTIGRIDVRAVSPPQPPAQERAPAAPRMSLDDYLRQQNGGRR